MTGTELTILLVMLQNPCLLQVCNTSGVMVQTSKPILMISHFIVLFSHGTLNSTNRKQIVNPTPVMCQQFLECMKVTNDHVSAIDAATYLWTV